MINSNKKKNTGGSRTYKKYKQLGKTMKLSKKKKNLVILIP